MHKRFLLSMVCIFIMLLSGCMIKTAELKDEDYQYWLNTNQNWNNIAESPEGYYINTNTAMMFVDRQTLCAVPLCGKPECPHDFQDFGGKPEEYDCNAWFPGYLTGGKPCWTGGRLYITFQDPKGGDWKVAEVSADGAVRRDVLRIGEGKPVYSLVHRGKLYITRWVAVEQTNAGTLFADTGIEAYDLAHPQRKPVRLYDRENAFDDGELYRESGLSQLIAYDHFLYFLDYGGDGSGTRAAWLIDLDTGALRKLPLQEDPGDSVFLAVCGGRLLVTRVPLTEAGEEALDRSSLLSYAPDGSDARNAGLFPHSLTGADGTHLYQFNNTLIDPAVGGDGLRVYNADLEPEASVPLSRLFDDPDAIRLFHVFVTTGDDLILKTEQRAPETGGVRRTYWLVKKADLGMGRVPCARLFSEVTDGRSGHVWLEYGDSEG